MTKKQPHPKKVQPNGIKKQNTLLRYQTTNTLQEWAADGPLSPWGNFSILGIRNLGVKPRNMNHPPERDRTDPEV